MKSKRILVTGGCGFIGSHFIRQLLTGGEDSRPELVVNVDLLTYAGNLSNLVDVSGHSAYRFQQKDIGDEEEMFRCLQADRIDTVVNLAAESHVDRSIDSPEPFFATNVIGTMRLLNAFYRHWKTFGRSGDFRFVHVSTDEVYGSLEGNDPPCNETTGFAPNSPYAASKASGEHLVRSFYRTYGVPGVTSRGSNTYGPYQFPEKLIPLMILNALDGRPLPVYGEGNQIRDWLYVEDHSRGIQRVLLDGRVGETYNVGGLNQMTNLEVVQAICGVLDRKQPRSDGQSYRTLIQHVEDRPGHDLRYAMDGGKAERELGWTPREAFESGMEKTVDWYLANRPWADAISGTKYSRERLGRPEPKMNLDQENG